MSKRKWTAAGSIFGTGALALVLAASIATAVAQDAGSLQGEVEAQRQTTIKLIELMVQSGILTKERAEELLREARREAGNPASAGDASKNEKEKVIRIPYVPQIVRDDIKEEIRQEVVEQARKERWGEPGALPDWIGRIKFHGEFRLRYQYNQFDPGNSRQYLNIQDTNAGNGLVPLNTIENNDLWRIRLRLAMDARLADWASVGMRLSTGSNTNPVSDNQTLGNTFNRNNFALDRAFVRLEPNASWMLIGGRMANPFFHSDLVWDEDLNFEGVATTVRPSVGKAIGLFTTIGAFPLEKLDCTNTVQIADCGKSKWIYGFQLGTEQSFSSGNRLKIGIALYDFRKIAGTFNDPIIDPANRSSIPKYVQKGNSMFDVRTDGGNPLLGLAADFRELSLTGQWDMNLPKARHLTLLWDAVKNIGYDRNEIRDRTGGLIDQDPRTLGYQFRLTVGQEKMEKRGDWQVSGGYKYLERDAVVDGFTESDFHLGGTDAKGWILGASYGIAT
ncbi:MAG: putative porin, partial [Burkholderiales bacterium]